MAADGDWTVMDRKLTVGKPVRTLAAGWHRQRYHSPAAEQFLAVLRAVSAAGRET